MQRIASHTKDKKFSYYAIIEFPHCPKEKLRQIEADYITKYTPKYNGSFSSASASHYTSLSSYCQNNNYVLSKFKEFISQYNFEIKELPRYNGTKFMRYKIKDLDSVKAAWEALGVPSSRSFKKELKDIEIKLPTRPKQRYQPKGEVRVIIAGNNDFDDYTTLKKKCDTYIPFLTNGRKVIIATNKEGNVHKLALRYAQESNYDVEAYVANWDKLGKMAGIVRNEAMAIECDCIIAFHDGCSKGIENLIYQMKLKGKAVRAFTYDPKGQVNI
jgi:hypothetical protein